MDYEKKMPQPAQNYGEQGAAAPPPAYYQPAQQAGYPPQQGGYPQAYPAQTYGAPQPQPQRTQTTVIVQNGNGWFSTNQRNKPQSNAVGAASLIFISGGMNIAWSVGYRGAFYTNIALHTRVAWFIGAIIGALLSCGLPNKIPRKIIMCFSSLLVIIGGILFVSTRFNFEAIEAALYMDGIGNGLCFAPALALIGEVAVPYMRGSIAAPLEQQGVILGFFIQIIYVISWGTELYDPNEFNANQLHGVLSIVYGIIALVLGALLSIESPVMLLDNGEEQRALDAQRRLQRPYIVTNETHQLLEESKRYVAMNRDMSLGESIAQALPAFFKLCYLRALNAMSLCSYMTVVLALSLLFQSLSGTLLWQFFLFAACRWIGTFITSFCTESVGRKKLTLMGLFFCCPFAIAVGALLYGNLTHDYLNTIFILLCIFQVFAGVAFTPSSCYLTEAYPLKVKTPFIACTFIVEAAVYIIISSCTVSVNSAALFFIIMGALCLAGCVVGFVCLPETKRTTLRQALDKFKGIVSPGF
ncbi:sugar transport protein 5 [Drosophila busckii]|uniref:sugar transport protein 5 n=1 Tax=Drosophila busckii TaxID=30019 RepID=UPI0014332404|nr:sugar transport protein 5 [Drosophila busckii]